jgi:amino acid adenylation domain-containing protein/non-ribosomal peptide synthase protein (TIGR01720 family)
MTLSELVVRLRDAGVNLWLEGERLRFSAPAGALTAPLRAEVLARREEIITLLRFARPAAEATFAPIASVPRNGPLPLSFGQARLFFLDQIAPGSASYNIAAALRIEGTLDVEALEQSLRALIVRHESLRTTFVLRDGEATARIYASAPAHILDVRHVSSDDETLALAQMEAARPFDLARGPLLRTTLLRRSERHHVLLFSMHHIISDGWSTGVIVREVAALYGAFVEGRPDPLPTLPITYVDYAAWQRAWLSGKRIEQQIAFWKEQLLGAPLSLELPTDRTRPAVQTYAGARHTHVLAPSLLADLHTLARQNGATLFMTLLAAFHVLLARHSGQSDVVVGTPIANRTRAETEGLIGFFVNTLAMRACLTHHMSFVDLLAQVKARALDAYAHQDLPFERLVEELRLPRDLSRSPLFQVMFALQNTTDERLALDGLTFSPLETAHCTAKFDVALSAVESEGRLTLAWEYNTDLFDAATVERIASRFEVLLRAVAEDAHQRVFELSLLTDSERRTLLVDWNDTRADFPRDVSIQQLFEAQVQRTPDAIAVAFEDEALSYRQLNERANQIAHYLQSLGVGLEFVVALYFERSLDLVVALLGVLKAGAAYLPLDPEYPHERLAFMLRDSRARAVLALGHTPPEALAPQGCVWLAVDALRAALSSAPVHNPALLLAPQSAAYVIYTSGSTGTPKGVVNSHQGLFNRIAWMQATYPLNDSDAVLQKTPYGFDVSVWEFLWPLSAGARLVLARPRGHRDPNYLAQLIDHQRITTLHFVPSMLGAFLDAAPAHACRTLRRVFASGEALSCDLVRRFAHHLPGLPLHNLYGPTEAAIDVTAWACDPLCPVVPIGSPIANLRLYILDPLGQSVPTGVAGELHIAGIGLARGYLHQPALTAERFVPNPFGTGDRLYRTGDLARYLPDGNIAFLGRNDHQIKLRGFRIELGEIEARLRELPAARDAIVVTREDSPGEKQLVAYLLAEELPAPQEIRAALKDKLPDYMVPAAFVALSAWPLTPNGKVDRKALPAPGPTRETGTAHVPPRTENERLLARVWSKLLRVNVGVRDNFFDVGGDSILAIQMASRARAEGLQFTVKQIFEHQTIEALSTVARAGTPTDAEQGEILGAAPLTPIQRRFFSANLRNIHHFNQAVLLEMPHLDVAALHSALAIVVGHHDALRLRFVLEEGGWTQVHREAAIGVVHEDFSTIPPVDQPSAIEQRANELQASLDIERGPLLVAAYFDLGVGRSGRLLLAAHHLLVDGVSWRILLQDLHDALVQEKATSLPAKTTSYKAWAERLVAYATSDAASAELPCWMSLPWSRASRLPVEQHRPGALLPLVRKRTVSLDVGETSALLQRVQPVYRTQVTDVLLAALARTLTEWTGGRAALFDLEGHGREEELFEGIDLSRTVGWFTIIFPVLLEVDPSWDPGDLLKSIKEQLRRVPSKGFGHGVLRYMRDDAAARLARLPAPEVAFNYLGQLDQTLDNSPMFRLARESAGATQDPANALTHRITIDAAVFDGRLSLGWTYDAAAFSEGTLAQVSDQFVEHLRALIAHCLAPDAGGVTVSDFPLAKIAQQALDRIVGTGREIEDVYRLSPMQRGMLFHSVTAPSSGVYIVQLVCTIGGDLRTDAFGDAWGACIARHPILRTSFHWRELDEPVQVVHKRAALHIEEVDWRALSEDEQEEQLENYIASVRREGFDLARPPLMRLFLATLGDRRRALVWSQHHIICDGWSLQLQLQEVFEVYRGRGDDIRHAPPPYVSHIRWLARQDLAEAERFWRGRLEGFSGPTPLGIDHAPRAGNCSQRDVTATLPEDASTALRAFAQRHRVTPSTLVQAGWALLLHRYSGRADIVFGEVVSGRSPEIAGVESIVGPFINTVPVRVRFSKTDTVAEWLRRLQAEQIEARRYDFCPLQVVQQWSAVAAPNALFHSLVAFENYPVDSWRLHAADIYVRNVRTIERVSYPLALVAEWPRGKLALKIQYDPARFDASVVQRAVQHLITLLGAMPEDDGRLITDLCATKVPAVIDAASRVAVADANAGDATPDAPAWPLAEVFAATYAGARDSFFGGGANAAAGAEVTPIAPIAPSPLGVPREMSHAQRRLWYLHHSRASLPTLNAAAAVRVDTPEGLCPQSLRDAIRAVMRRHETLRTCFEDDTGAPSLRIESEPPPAITITDLRRQRDAELILADVRRHEEEAPFDLTRAPLFRVHLIRLEQGRDVVLVTTHPIVADGWSIGVLLRDLLAHYNAVTLRAGPSMRVEPPLRIQHGNYMNVYDDWIRRQPAHGAFWRAQFHDLPGELDLPTDFPRATNPSYRGARHRSEFDRALSRQISRKLGISNSAALLGLYRILLFRYSNQADIVVGVPIAGRFHPELEDQIGCYANVAPLRARLTADQPVGDVLRAAQKDIVAAFEHQLYPIDRLIRDLDIDVAPGWNRLFQAALVVQRSSRDDQAALMPPMSIAAHVDLTFVFDQEDTFAIDYRATLFCEVTIAGFAQDFVALVAQAARDPEVPLSALTLLSQLTLLDDNIDHVEFHFKSNPEVS